MANRNQHEDKVLLVLTLIIGAVVGLVVVAFIVLTENLGARMYPPGSAAWRRVLIPVAGSLITGFLLYRYFPNARGSGIPQTKTALFLRDGYISFRTVVGKFGLCSVSLATGIALGREGPSVQVGSGIASTLGRRLGLSPSSIKALVPAGASAALAAAFNTPISAVLFSLEEVMGDMHAPVLGSIVLSSATSWIMLHLILGDEPLFHVPVYQLVHPVEFGAYAVLGVVGGLVSAAFVKLLLWQRKYFLKAPKRVQWVMPVAGGLTVGLLGWFYPEVLGVGYGFVGKALNGQLLAGAMALLVLLKLIATATCYASGNAGGIFGPSLFMGAMLGGAVGGVAHMIMPDYTGSVGAYALVGMGAAFAGIVRVPLTSVIMVFEITRDYSIIVPLMIANLISYLISSKLQKEPIYEALQHQDGIHLPSGARARESLLMVGNAYRPEAQILSSIEKISQAAASVDRERAAWPVVDQGGFRGMVNIGQLDEAVRTGRGESTLAEIVPELPSVEEWVEAGPPRVYPDDPLDAAMRLLADGSVKALPVLSRANMRELKGTVSLADVLAAYSVAGRELGHETPAGVSGRRFPIQLAAVLAALAGLAIMGAFANYYYRAERGKRAEQSYRAGNELMRNSQIAEAIEQYRNALSISHSAAHRLALGLALVKAERPNEASIYLKEVLRDQPNNGPANLAMAGIAAQDGLVDDATRYYHSAIAGSWPDQPVQNRVQARIQLAQFLENAGRRPQARAALVSLAADLPEDPALKRQVGRMALKFGLPREAADLFRDALRLGSREAAVYVGLGDADFLAGDYRSAKEAYRRALSVDPGDRAAMRREETCDRILALDPALRGIRAKERFQRSQELLRETLARVVTCAGSESALPEASKSLIVKAHAALAGKRASASLSDSADADLQLAEELWAQRPGSCPSPGGDDPLGLILSRTARQ